MLDINESLESGNIEENKAIRIECPICKSKKQINLPKSQIKQTLNLTTISIPKGYVCSHQFQIFVDKNFKVRGYQKVDFEIQSGNKDVQNDDNKDRKDSEEDLFENLVLEGNFLEYKPKKSNVFDRREIAKKGRELEMENIYNEFWEFIDDDNEEFSSFIINDKRRNGLKSDHSL